MGIIMTLLIGALVGWLASKLMKAKFGLVAYIIIGIVGSFVGDLLFGLLGMSSGFIGSVIGAALVLFVLDRFKK